MWLLCDSLARIKNASMRKNRTVKLEKSKFILKVVSCLEKEGYINSFSVAERYIEVQLKYKNEKPVITGLEMVSKPSKKVYMGYEDIKKSWLKGETLVYSTNLGIFTNNQISKNNYFGLTNIKVGGEVLFKIV